MNSSDFGDYSNSKDIDHTNKKVTLMFSHPVSSQPLVRDVQTVQVLAQPTHHVYALEMVRKLENDLDSVALDPARLIFFFRILLPAKDAGSSSGDTVICSGCLFCAVALALAVNFNCLFTSDYSLLFAACQW